LEVPGSYGSKLQQLQPWLEKHAGQLNSLTVCGKPQFRDKSDCCMQLPAVKLTQLHSLSLSNMLLQLPDLAAAAGAAPRDQACAGTSAAPAQTGRQLRSARKNPGPAGSSPDSTAQAAAVAVLPALSSLKLEQCRLQDMSCLSRLSWPSGLTRLDLDGVVPYPLDEPQWISVGTAALAGLLKQLTNLQQLQLRGFPAIWGTVQHITAMQGLADLHLEWLFGSSEECPSTVPQTLTRLLTTARLQAGGPLLAQPELYPRFLATLQQLQQLRVLELKGAVFDPAHLASLTHLQRLRLKQCKLLPVPIEASDNSPSAQGTTALLGALNSLPHLEHLSLGLRLDTQQIHGRFTSLVASSKLTSVQLDTVVCETSPHQPLPKRAVFYICSRPLPQLQQLCISMVADTGYGRIAEGDGHCISKADLRCIMGSCPSLQQLDLRCTLTPGKDVTALRELQACRVLIVWGQWVCGSAGRGDWAAHVADRAAVASISYLDRYRARAAYNPHQLG
jgi:hypothetical protein